LDFNNWNSQNFAENNLPSGDYFITFNVGINNVIANETIQQKMRENIKIAFSVDNFLYD